MNPFELSQLRSGKPDCPSDVALHRLSAGELQGDELKEVRGHAEGCQACAARLAQIRQGFAAHPEADPVRMLAAIRRAGAQQAAARPWAAWLRVLLPAVAVAGGVALVVRDRPAPEVAQPQTRSKGSPVLHVFKDTAGGREVQSGDQFREGDRLQFKVDLPAPAAVQVFGIDAAGHRYAVWPQDDAAVRMDTGPGQLLHGAVRLDDAPGTETLYLVTCPPDQQNPSCVSGGPGAPPKCNPGCTYGPFVLQKGP